jgi:DNA-binding transcriptional regulator YdaS (Cro superfamily)
MTHTEANKKLDELVKVFGSKYKLAKKLGISPQAINDWRLKGRIPSGSAIKIEVLTEGKFLARHLVGE